MVDSIAQRPPAAFFRLATDQWTKPFWDAAVRRELTASRCADCHAFRMPPTPFCPNCRSQRIEWIQLSGRGAIYSYTIVSHAVLPDTQSCLPYVPAVVELEGAGGTRLISNIVGVPVNKILVGAPVIVVWDEAGGVTVPRFTLI